MSSFICVVGLSPLSCILVRMLLFSDVVLLLAIDLGGEGEWPYVGCLTACITVNRSADHLHIRSTLRFTVIQAVKQPT